MASAEKPLTSQELAAATAPTLPAPQAGVLPPAEPPNIQARRRSGLPSRVPRRPEEDVPGADYVKCAEALGPRRGESLLAFRKRLCMIVGTRQLWMDTWREHSGDRGKVARALGIPVSNLASEMRLVGLSAELLSNIGIKKV